MTGIVQNERSMFRPRPVVAPPPMSEGLLNGMTIAVGLLQAHTIPFVGSVPLGEVAMVLFLPIMFYGLRNKQLAGEYRATYFFMALWILGQIISNFANDANSDAWAKGLAALVFFLMDIVGLRLLLRGSTRRKFLLALGLSLANIANIYIGNPDFLDKTGTIADNWKFGWGPALSKMVALAASLLFLKRRYTLAIILVLFVGGANLYYNARSLYLLTVLSIVLVAPLAKPAGSVADPKVRKKAGIRFAVVLLALALGVFALGELYGYVASSGLIGYAAQNKYFEQTAGPAGLLFTARPELLPDIAAVKDSPLIGYGYHGQGDKYVEMYFEDEAEISAYSGLPPPEEEEASIIPAHSYLFCGWLWAGALGAVFWIYILVISGKAAFQLTMLDTYLSPYYSIIICFQIWNIFCAPFGLGARMESAFAVVVVLDVLREFKSMRDGHQLS